MFYMLIDDFIAYTALHNFWTRWKSQQHDTIQREVNNKRVPSRTGEAGG